MCETEWPGHTENCVDLLAMRYAAHDRLTKLELPQPTGVREWDTDYWFASDGGS